MVGSAITTGPDEALALMESVQTSLGMDCMVVEVLAITAQGNTVLIERIDNVRESGGNDLMSVRTMGIFEVERGKLTA